MFQSGIGLVAGLGDATQASVYEAPSVAGYK